MKNTVKITACGIISALSVILMMATNIPIMLFTVPAVTGMLYIIPSIEFGTKWAFLCYGVTSILSLILPTEREALVVFIGILGYYPILKMIIEKHLKRPIGYVVKFLVFNIAIIVSYFIIVKVLGIPALDNEKFGFMVTCLILLAVGNAVFALYDLALTRLTRLYFLKLRKPVRKMLGIKGKY